MLPIVTIEGRAVADPELRFAQSGVAVARLRLVQDKKKKDPNTNEWVDDKVLWINVTCFKDLAEHVAESIQQGDLVIAVGQLQTDSWETQEGDKRSATVLIANNVGASLRFRNIPHGAGQAARSSGGSAEPDPFAQPAQSDEPPF